MDMEETSTPTDFLDHEPSKHEKLEVRLGEICETEPSVAMESVYVELVLRWNSFSAEFSLTP